MSKLSKTEIEAGRLYFEHGLKPRQIAEKLKISINTVYKALSKYRNLYLKSIENREEVKRDEKISPTNNITFTFNVVNYSRSAENLNSKVDSALLYDIETLRRALIRIEDTLNEVKKLLLEVMNKLTNMNINTYTSSHVDYSESSELDVPEFLRNNIWIDVIRSKASRLEVKNY